MSSPKADAPYTLVQIDLPTSSPVPPLSLAWHHLSAHATEPSPLKPSTKPPKEPTSPLPNDDGPRLLHDVSGDAQPGELVMIVGSSSEEISTLLHALAGRTPALTTGSVRVNDQTVRMTPTIAAFVDRDYPTYATLTVREHLELQARLQLSEQTTPSERATRVTNVLSQVGLTDVATSLIGDSSAVQGLSARNRKLLALATELLLNPSIILVNEPTAGLDASAAKDVAQCLRSLARSGHTVAMTMPLSLQPTSAMFTFVDKLHVVANGRTVFHGKPHESLAFLQTHGLTCPLLTNPFEFFADVLSEDHSVTTLASAWTTRESLTTTSAIEGPVLESSSIVRPHRLATQLGVLTQRNALRLAHDKATIIGRLRQSLLIAVVIGLIFLRIDVSQTHIQSFSSACFFAVASQFMTAFVPEITTLPNEVALVLRDHHGRLYHALNWYIVKNITELPLQVLYPLVFLTPAYFLVGFPTDAEVFFSMYLFLFLAVSTGVAVSLLASCLAPRSKAMIVGILLAIPALVFGGPFLNRKSVPDYFLWIQQISPVKYAYHGLMRAFWTHVDKIPCAPGGICRAPNGRAVLAMNFIHPDTFASDWQLLLVINVAMRVLGGVALAWRAARGRSYHALKSE